jgi:hypothetical protein
MTDENFTDTGITGEPVADATAARVQADYDSAQERKAEEAALAAEQDAALAEVVARCEAERLAYAESLARPAG